MEEYSWFVAKIREFNKPCGDGTRPKVEEAIDRAIEEMPDGFEIKKLIVANRAEVKDMCLTEYNEAEAMEMFKEEGREKGREDATVVHIKEIMEKLKYTVEQAMDLLSIPPDQHSLYKGLLSRK